MFFNNINNHFAGNNISCRNKIFMDIIFVTKIIAKFEVLLHNKIIIKMIINLTIACNCKIFLNPSSNKTTITTKNWSSHELLIAIAPWLTIKITREGSLAINDFIIWDITKNDSFIKKNFCKRLFSKRDHCKKKWLQKAWNTWLETQQKNYHMSLVKDVNHDIINVINGENDMNSFWSIF